ncbi:hypothetical protein BaRGS_00014965 [Batillaria attramentaria]|uniref:Uncharacterized protein n=1 Tax=Batillaria attramentaria TaxID=370345 RepID=A0ABD0L3W7_9CAEN
MASLRRVKYLYTILVVLLKSIDIAHGQTIQQNASGNVGNDFEGELIQKLFSRRSHMVPPYTYNNDGTFNPVNVGVRLDINSISGLDMRSQQFTFTGWFLIFYTDPLLSWDTAVYLVDAIFVKPEDIWIPDMVLYNSVFPIDQLVKQKMPVKVRANGLLWWTPGDTITTTCDVNIRLFPFDTQTCTIRIGPWAYSDHQINCTDVSLSVVNGTAEFDVTHSSWRIDRTHYNDVWFVEYSVTLRRKWLFYAMNVVLPVVLVSALNSVVFVLPVQCGEKMSVSLTTFLTLAVFMTLIQDSLPSNSDTVCYLAVYLASQMVLSVAAVVVSAVRVACHHRHVKEENEIQNFQDTCSNPVDAEKGTSVDWQRLGVVIDRICFPVFTGFSVLSFLAYGIITVL